MPQEPSKTSQDNPVILWIIIILVLLLGLGGGYYFMKRQQRDHFVSTPVAVSESPTSLRDKMPDSKKVLGVVRDFLSNEDVSDQVASTQKSEPIEPVKMVANKVAVNDTIEPEVAAPHAEEDRLILFVLIYQKILSDGMPYVTNMASLESLANHHSLIPVETVNLLKAGEDEGLSTRLRLVQEFDALMHDPIFLHQPSAVSPEDYSWLKNQLAHLIVIRKIDTSDLGLEGRFARIQQALHDNDFRKAARDIDSIKLENPKFIEFKTHLTRRVAAEDAYDDLYKIVLARLTYRPQKVISLKGNQP